MSEPEIHRLMVWALFGLAAAAFLFVLWRPAPYGRHYTGTGWGPTVSGRMGWIGMECPAVFLFLFVYLQGSMALSTVPLAFLAIWQIHYINRTLIYPFRLRTGQRMPLVTAGSGFFFNVLNAYVNARFVSHLGEYGVSWLSQPCFLIGLVVFYGGHVAERAQRPRFAEPPETGKDRIRHPRSRRLPVRLLPELPRRNTGMDGLGDRDLVAWRAGVLRFYHRQPGTQSP